MSQEIRFADLAGFFEKQEEFDCTVDKFQFVLYGGSRGPGKSYALRWKAAKENLRLVKAGIKRPVGGLFCEDYKVLTDRQISKIAIEFPPWLGRVRDSKEHGLGFHFNPDYGGGVIALRNLDDPSKYQSAEFAYVAVDELTKIELDTFNILRGSLRWPGVPKPRFFAATNPGSVGHIWVKAFWIDGVFPREMADLSREFRYVRALPTDNTHLDESYWLMLESLPTALARAWRFGDWDVFEGQYFPELNRDIHGFHDDELPEEHGSDFVMMDYGYDPDPAAVYWARVARDGSVFVYRELYTTCLKYSDLAERMIELNGGSWDNIHYTVAPTDIFARERDTGRTGAEILGACGVPVMKADMNRVEGWRQMREFLDPRLGPEAEDGTRSPLLRVSLSNCPNWWRTVPALVHDEHKVEDVDKKGEDHAGDSIRYGLQTRPRPIMVKAEKIDPFTAQAVLDHLRSKQRR